MTEAAPSKTMTEGEGGLAMAFSILALLALVGAAKAEDTAFAFHAYLTAAASIAVVFGIFNHYFDRPPALPPQGIEGRPNYHFGPVKLAIGLAICPGSISAASGRCTPRR
jgi:cytochrome c oxidase cbb3-type subunit 1